MRPKTEIDKEKFKAAVLRKLSNRVGNQVLTKLIHGTIKIGLKAGHRRLTEKKPDVYWWSEEIFRHRNLTNSAKRHYKRIRGESKNPDEMNAAWEKYKIERNKLRYSIANNKKNCWKELCENLDTDIWGDGYKIVISHFKNTSLLYQYIQKKELAIINNLFPQDILMQENVTSKIPKITMEELQKAKDKNK